MNKKIKFLAMMFVITAFATSCGKDDVNPSDPNQKVPDPAGTVELDVRNASNGGNSFVGIGINQADNFYSNSSWKFASMGEMKGVGNITTIPESGYADQVGVRPGRGYVGKRVLTNGVEYIAFYVDDYILAAGTNGIIGAYVKYVYPFIPPSIKSISATWTDSSLGQTANSEMIVTLADAIPYTVTVAPTTIFAISNIDTKSFRIYTPKANNIGEITGKVTINAGTITSKEIGISQKGLFAGGTGTQNDPCLIKTIEQLKSIQNVSNTYFRLENNIDLTSHLANSSEGWNPINLKDNRFDGGGYTISGLWINRPSTTGVGLFASVSGYPHITYITSLNVQLSSKGIIGGDYTGGLVGSIGYSNIENCSVTGNITGINYTGGIVGSSGNSGNISRCYSTGNVEGTVGVGGIVGRSSYYSGEVIDSYSTSNVTINSSTVGYAGGIVGFKEFDGIITNSYYAGKITGGGGGLSGYAGIIKNSYFDKEKAEVDYSIPPSNTTGASTTAQMKQQATYSGWDFNSVWQIQEGVSYPTLR
ncbi:MAG: DUF5036 family protein [Prevotellaceae bacterium]|nr:DUF5036 family protein [Prevotellaceae bacterium]